MDADIDATAENAVQALRSDAGSTPDYGAVTAKEAAPNGRLLNAARNCTRLRPLKIGELPRELERVERSARQYRRYLEAATLEACGEIGTIALTGLMRR